MSPEDALLSERVAIKKGMEEKDQILVNRGLPAKRVKNRGPKSGSKLQEMKR